MDLKGWNWDQIQGKWTQFRGLAKVRWSELTDGDLMKIDGRRDELVGKIQEIYGISRREAEDQVEEFRRTLH